MEHSSGLGLDFFCSLLSAGVRGCERGGVGRGEWKEERKKEAVRVSFTRGKAIVATQPIADAELRLSRLRLCCWLIICFFST